MLAFVIVQSWLRALLPTSMPAVTRRRAHPSPVPGGRGRTQGDCGQTTAEYALVMIGAAALALLLIAWATRTDRVGQLFDFVMEHITGRVR